MKYSRPLNGWTTSDEVLYSKGIKSPEIGTGVYHILLRHTEYVTLEFRYLA